MDSIQQMMNLITENSKLKSLVNGAFSTNKLIEELEKVSNKKLPILIYMEVIEYDNEYNETGRHQETVNSDFYSSSWRGSYNLPCISYELSSMPFSTVKDVIDKLSEFEGTEMYGYKGGEYALDGSDPLFIANYGESNDSTAFVAIVEKEDHVALIANPEMY